MYKHVAAALFCCLSLVSINAGAVVAPESEGERYFDIRTTGDKPEALLRLRAASPGAAARSASALQGLAAAEAALRRTTPGLRIQLSAEVGGPEIVGVARGARVLTGPSSQRRETIARGFVERNAALYGLTRSQAAGLQLDADYVNPAGNLGWVRLAQYVNGRPVFGSEVTVALTPAGEIARVVGQLAGAIEPAEAAQLATVGAAQAVMLAATDVGIAMLPGDLQQLSVSADGRSARFASRVLDDEVEAKQVYFPLGQGALELAWSMVIWEPVHAYYTVIAARDGTVLWRKNITDHEAHTYRVFDGANPAPFQPGPTDPTLNLQAPRVAPVDLLIDSQVSTSDPWLTVGQATTDGNNVEAGLDITAPDGVDAPLGESGLNAFLYSSNPPPGSPAPGEDPTTIASRNAAVTNLFYWSNRFHNLTYDLGFTEPARNFQNDNYGRGGLGGDRVRSEAQDSSGTNNANFNTPPDGGRGRNQMYLWTLATPNRDGSFDAEIVIHELAHGLSNRLHNNAAGLNTNMARAMGEGWSDFYAHSLLAKPTDPINGIYVTGGYSTLGLFGSSQNYYYGIRRFPKAVIAFTGGPNNRPHNPLTFADIDSTQVNLTDGAYPPGPISGNGTTTDQVHNAGEVWSSALWEARAQIIADMGAVAGNQRMLQLVTDGMKLSPSGPTFLQARDAIIAADCAAYGGSSEIDLWTGFALRGMGFDAQVLNAGTGSNNTRVVESFAGSNGAVPVEVGTTGWQALSCPTANRNPTPGDVVQLVVPITNPLCGAALTNVVVSAPGGGSQSYPTLAAGATQTALVSYTIPLDAVCGTTIQVPVTITHDNGTQSIMVAVPVGEAAVGTTSFSNSTLVNIPNGQPGTTSGVASPYPSNITVSGITQPVLGVRVTLNGLAHTWPSDIDMLLVGPTGQKLIFFSDAFNSQTLNPVSSVVEFRDDAAALAPSGAGSIPATASYLPTNHGANDAFAAPAPAAPYLNAAPGGAATFASAFGGLDANGTWSLYIVDDAGGDVGTLASGWTLTVLTSQPVVCIPCAVAGVTVTESGGTTAVSEGGATDSYEVVLNAAPAADVTVNLAFNAAQLTVNGDTDGSTSLLFTAANWDTPQAVAVVATNDMVVEAPLANSVIAQTITSADPAYAAIDPADVTVAVTDNDIAVVGFAANDDVVGEAGGNFQKAVVLTITASGVGPSSLQNALSVPLTFTEGSALEPEDFTLTTAQVTFPAGATSGASQNAIAAIVNDAIDEDAESFAINLVTAGAPGNINFNRIVTNVQITDNDSAGVILTQIGGGTAVTEGGATDTYTLMLASQPTAPVTISLVGVQVTPSTAVPPLANKAAPPPASVVFSAGNWNQPQTVTVSADDDTVVEGAHAGSVTHDVASADPKYQALPVPPLAVAIADNDTAELIFSSAGFNTVEGAQFSPGATLKVTGNGAQGGSVAAEIVATMILTPDTASTDDVAVSGSFVFPAGSGHDTVVNSAQVTVTDDRAVEASESFDVALSISSGLATTGAVNTYSIADNDSAAIGFASPTSNAPEGTTPHAVNALLTITGVGSGPLLLQDTASVVITDTPGTATTPADYTRTTASVSFPAGSADGATQPIQSSIVDDALFEGNHDFALGFGAVTAASASVTAAGAHTVTITDNDPMPTISITSPSQPEGDGGNTPMTFTVSLSVPAGVDVTFTRATADGTAMLADNDYLQLAVAGGSIAAGQTNLPIEVQIVGDTTFEGDESFSLNLTNIVNALPAGAPVIEGMLPGLTGTGTIEDDDQQPTTTTIISDDPDASVVGQPYTVVVEVAAVSSSPLGTVTVSDGSASCGPVALTTGTAPDSSASCMLTSTTAGAKTLVASYTAASTAFADSVSVGEPHQVNAAATAISVVGPARSRINQPTSFTFALSVNAPGAGSPAGTVTLTSGTASCDVTVPTATPSCALTFDALGPRTVSAAFVPSDGNFLGSSSDGAGNAQTLVFALSDIAVTKSDGLGTYRPGDLVVYTVTVRNLGADAAAQIRVIDNVPAGLVDVVWTCDASGGVACPQAGGSGNLDMNVASFPIGGLLNVTFYGNVDGNPAQLVNTALVQLPADATIEDPVPGNNSATDTNLLELLFRNGFEAVAVNAPAGSFRLPSASLRGSLDEVAVVVYVLDDADGEALRVYARVIGDEVQYALAMRNGQGRLRLGAWASYADDPLLTWTARPVAEGWVLDSAALR
jgi:uncharacterized repeat protein (TIGR01451 family)